MRFALTSTNSLEDVAELNATKTNAEVNDVMATTGTMGTMFLVVGAYQSSYTIFNSKNPVRETATEGSGWAGAMYVGSEFATGTAPLGPYVSFWSGLVGSTIGFIGGKKAGDAAIDAASEPHTWQFPFVPFSLSGLFR